MSVYGNSVRFLSDLMNLRNIYFCFLWLILINQTLAQQNIKAGWDQFEFLFWPEKGGLIESSTIPESVIQNLRNAWHESLLPVYTNKVIQFRKSESESLDWYRNVVENTQPACIEGDAWYIEQVINHKDGQAFDRQYIPILRVKHPSENERVKLQAEIVFRNQSNLWTGILGVVHSDYSVGGKTQLEYWKRETGGEADMVAFHSSREVLRHLFAGTIDAAAVPKGELDSFLNELDNNMMLSQFIRISIPNSDSNTFIFLKKDLFTDAYIRTLISETWLRNNFPDTFEYVPYTFPQ